MQILRNVNIDWLGKTKYFLAISMVLLLLGGWAWYTKGLRYGIDFRGGTMVYLRFAEMPGVDQIRAALAQRGLGNSIIQQSRDVTGAGTSEVVIQLELQAEDEVEALEAGKEAILAALREAFDRPEPNKQDFNAATPADVAAALVRRDPLALGPAAGERYNELAEALLAFRDRERSGLLTSFEELRSLDGINEAVLAALGERFYLGRFAVRSAEIVGPRVGQQLRQQAVLATLYALAGMLVYIAFRFEWIYGAAAVAAVVHDVLITLGLFILLNYELSLTVIAALLTLVGYSMNDTIVIFDRMRENLRLMRREPLTVIANRSINQTLSRTVLTSGLTFLVVLVLFLFGGEVLRGFSFVLVVGIVVGTYSSVGIAAAMVVGWANWRGRGALTGAAAGGPRKTENIDRRLATAGRR
ncbi:MAG: protein translocase subunit SecF [Firmicutes bacterium]|nr:protein translocase subunit SecF [Bacillota bacterium]